MPRTHNYKIIFNNELARYLYTFEYTYSSTRFTLKLAKTGACIETNMKPLKQPEEITHYRYFADAIRKAVFVYSVMFEKPLKQNSINVVIDGKSYSLFVKAQKDNPLVHSMLDEKFVRRIPETLKSKETVEWYLNIAKSNQYSETACYYSLLLSKTKRYESERFLYLWMAMNGFYNYLLRKEKSTINDTEGMKLLAEKFGFGKDRISRSDNDKVFHIVKSVLRKYIPNLQHNRHSFEAEENMTKEILDVIRSEIEKPKDISAYGYVLLYFAYKLRCNMFHANIPVKMLCYSDDTDIICMNFVSDLLEEFLDENFHYIVSDGTGRSELNELISRQTITV